MSAESTKTNITEYLIGNVIKIENTILDEFCLELNVLYK